MTASDLSPVDRDILEQLLAGKRSKEIARDARRPIPSISAEVGRIKKRIGVRTLVQLGYWAALHDIHPHTAGGQ